MNGRICWHMCSAGHSFDAVVTEFGLDLQWHPEAGEVTSARLVFDFADVETGRETRDEEMLDWLTYETYPLAEFHLEEIEQRLNRSIARGTLEMNGVAREIEIPVDLVEQPDGLRITGQTQIDHRDWDLERITLLIFIRVDPVLDVNFDIFARFPQQSDLHEPGGVMCNYEPIM